MRAADSVAADLLPGLGARGLTMGQLGVLETLLHLGPMCQRQLGEKLLRSSSNVTTVVDNLERRRLVVRERSADDRRVVTVRLTDSGRHLVERFFPEHARGIAAAMGHLSAAEQRELARLCRKLGRGVASA